MHKFAYAGVLAGTLGLCFSDAARAEPEIAIRECTIEDQQNSKEVQDILNRDPGVEEGVKQIAKGIKKVAKGKKPSHPVVIFFKVLFESKPAY